MSLFVADREKRILDRFAKDRSRAMADLYNGYAPYLAGVAYRYVCDGDRMKDVLQESFIKIFSNIGTFEYRGKGSLKAWMVRVVVNECLQELRRSSRTAQTLSIEGKAEDSGTEIVPLEIAEEPEPDVSGLSMDELVAMIARLPEGYRMVFNMYVFDEMSHKEIAAILGIKENTSASQFHKARKMLAEMIRSYRDDGGNSGKKGTETQRKNRK